MTITLYTKSNCQACRATKRSLDSMGAEYETVDLLEEGVTEMLQGKGFREAPVVDVGGTLWSGYDPLMLKKLKDGELNG